MDKTRFSAAALLLVQRAGEAAGEMGSPRIGSEHLLFALLSGPETEGSRMLRQLGWEAPLWRNILLSYARTHGERRSPVRAVSPHVRQILSLAGKGVQPDWFRGSGVYRRIKGRYRSCQCDQFRFHYYQCGVYCGDAGTGAVRRDLTNFSNPHIICLI